jgi:predicted nuclease with RNAse H fold
MLKKSIPLNTRVDKPLRDRIDAWRRAQPDLPPMSKAMRSLMERGLAIESGKDTTEDAA